jgi:hypothetical protein
MSNDGDQIYIDYAQGRPYMECENVTQSTCTIELTKSVSLYGINGRAELQCNKGCKFFIIKSPSFNITRIKFFNLIISSSNVVTEIDKGARMELVYQNMLVRDNNYAIYSEHSTDCSILITNSSFENNFNLGIYLRCSNLTARITSSTFELTPVSLTNIANTLTRWQKTEILIQDTIFNGKSIHTCVALLAIKPFAAIFNVTITDSEFKNHLAVCRSQINKYQYSTVYIYDHQSRPRNITFIFLSNLLVKNNYNNLPVLSLIVGFLDYTEVEFMIRDSIFWNNSYALFVSTDNFGRHPGSKYPIIIHENNTFVKNIYDLLKPDGAAAIYFGKGKSLVSSCRFFDNGPGQNPYMGVVKISEMASVTFFNSYFENRQTKALSNQLFASGNRLVKFAGENTFNLVALKESQTVFVRIPTALSNGVIMRKNFKILCPHGYKLHAQR